MPAVKNARSVLDVESFAYLRVDGTELANVCRVSLPVQPWKYGKAEEEKRSLVERLTKAFAFRALWLSDWAAGAEQGWRFLANDDSLSSLEGVLSNGGWTLVFFDYQPSLSFDALPRIPNNAETALRLLRELAATAVISSWCDDLEWLIATTDA